MKEEIKTTPEWNKAWDLIEKTNKPIFLTGKAGTGKSTFIRQAVKNINKEFVLLASTGIASINIGGQTAHSFFKIPITPIPPHLHDSELNLLKGKDGEEHDTVSIIKKTDTFIIDEISMLRADFIDAIDWMLRNNGGDYLQPFGGKQVVFVGDLFQIEPVLVPQVRADMKKFGYKTPLFFSADVFNRQPLEIVALQTVFRQSEKNYLEALNRFRVGCQTSKNLHFFNSKCVGNKIDTNKGIILAGDKNSVRRFNEKKLAKLKAKSYKFIAEIEGKFNESEYPTKEVLELKVGARVMFVKNDTESKPRKYVNGTLGYVTEINPKAEMVTVEKDDGEIITIDKKEWRKEVYKFDKKKGKKDTYVIGSFNQIPLKLAYALTIHKSQGLTFDNVYINLDKGTFANGQLYVALSRCRTIGGMAFSRPIEHRDNKVSPDVLDFAKSFAKKNIQKHSK